MKVNVKTKAPVLVSKEHGNTTRQMILNRANEIINNVGMVDFRIDALATSLGLSPGNITYHFPKKEDIGNAIWEQGNMELVQALDHYITPLLDIKQLFLFYKFLISNTYKYKGVACYKLGDLGLLEKGKETSNVLANVLARRYNEKLGYLISNEYLVKIEDKQISALTYDIQSVCLGWWVGHAVALDDKEGINVNSMFDKYAMMLIYPLVPFLTESGKKQLSGIISLVKK